MPTWVRASAARHCLPYTEWVADGEHEVSDLEGVRIAEDDRSELHALGVEAEYGEIGLLVLENNLGGKFAPI
jgi:hypothetical protein